MAFESNDFFHLWVEKSSSPAQKLCHMINLVNLTIKILLHCSRSVNDEPYVVSIYGA